MIIDFHTHIFPSFIRERREAFFDGEPSFEGLYRDPGSRLAGRRDLIGQMDEEGVHRAVVFGFPWRNPDLFRRHNDYIIESVLRHPDRLIGFCCFSPLSPEGPAEAERCIEAGLSGLGELAFYESGISSGDRAALKDLMEICLRLDLPVLIHANEPVGRTYPGKTPMTLRDLYALIREYPSNRIILAHWGGGLLLYGLMKREVRDVLRNTWFDTAASPYLYRPEIYRIACEALGPEKILFGSDYPLLRPGRYFREISASGIPPLDAGKILGENAAGLLGIPVP